MGTLTVTLTVALIDPFHRNPEKPYFQLLMPLHQPLKPSRAVREEPRKKCTVSTAIGTTAPEHLISLTINMVIVVVISIITGSLLDTVFIFVMIKP